MANQQVWELYIWLKADINWLKKDLKSLDKKIAWQARTTWKNVWKQISAWITSSVMKLVWAIWIFEWLKDSLNLAWTLEKNQIAFEQMLWSTEKANKLMQDLTDFAKNTPFELIWLQDTTKKIIGMWFEAEQAIPMLQILWDSVAAVWWNQDTLNGVVLALAQIKNKGKASAEELNQLAERGLPVYDILQKKLWLTAKEMWNIWNAGISSWKAIQALMEWLQERYSWMMQEQSKSFLGMLSNLKDNIDLFLADIWKTLIPKVKEWLNTLIDFFSQWGSYMGQEIWKTLTTFWDWVWEFLSFVVKWFKEAWNLISWDNKDTIDWIGANWQSIFFYIRTWFKAIVWAVKIAVEAISWFLLNIYSVWKQVVDGLVYGWKIMWKALIWVWKTIKLSFLKVFEAIWNFWIDMINWLIDAYNKLWDKVWLSLGRVERINITAGENFWNIWNDAIDWIKTDWGDMSDSIKTEAKIQEEINKSTANNVKDIFSSTFDDMMLDYVNTSAEIERTNSKTEKNTKAFTFNLKWMFDKLWNSISKSVWWETTKAVKQINDWFKWISKDLENQLWLYDKTKEKLKSIRDEYNKWKEDAHNAILEINNSLWELDQEQNNKLAERYVEIQKELANINKDIATTDDETEKQDLTAKKIQLENELALIKSNTNEEILKQAEAYDKLNESQKILLETEKERQKLNEQKWIYQAIEWEKWLLDNVIKTKEVDGQLTAEYFDKEKQQWIAIQEWENIQLAVKLENKRNQLLQETQLQLDTLEEIKQATENQTAQLNQIWATYYWQLETTTKTTTAKLLVEYQKIVDQLQQVYLWQQKTNTTWTTWYSMWWLVKWFADGWYTWWNTPLEPAGVVHQGEYVIPKWMTDSYSWLVAWLENIRAWWLGMSQKNVNVQFGDVVVNKDIDMDKMAYDLQWRLWFI